MAYRTGKFTDGIITVGASDEKLKMLMERYEQGARDAGKDPAAMPKMLQVKVSYAPTLGEATEAAVRDWPNGGMAFPKADIRDPEDFEAMAKLVRPENYKNRVLITPDTDEHVAYLQHFIDLGFGEIYVHNVGREQEEFIRLYGERVIPKLRWP
jgi:coenzyme F420-dependent glucose-6-phosphate dehydrogenase